MREATDWARACRAATLIDGDTRAKAAAVVAKYFGVVSVARGTCMVCGCSVGGRSGDFEDDLEVDTMRMKSQARTRQPSPAQSRRQLQCPSHQ